MRRYLLPLLILKLVFSLAACAGYQAVTRDRSTSAPSNPTPELTLTSVFEPMLTPTPTPYEDTPAVVTPVDGPLLDVITPELSSGQALTPTLVNFVDPLLGWGVLESTDYSLSGFILRTADGGTTWQPANPEVGFPQYSKFTALNATSAWATPADYQARKSVEAGYVWRTSDSGKNWQVSNPIDLNIGEEAIVEYYLPQALFFLDAQHGWLVVSVGHYMNQDVLEIFRSQDGGQTWQRTTDKYNMGKGDSPAMPCMVSGIAFVDAQHGFLAGNCLAVGVNDGWSILETKDGGITWQLSQLPEPAGVTDDLRSGMSSTATTCVAMDVWLTPAGILARHACQVSDQAGNLKGYSFLFLSSDSGQTWRGWAGEAASFVDANTGFSLRVAPGMASSQAKARELSTTTDGGQTWQVQAEVTWPGAQLNFVSPSDGFVVASAWNGDRNAYNYALVRTKDGGKSWEMVQSTIR